MSKNLQKFIFERKITFICTHTKIHVHHCEVWCVILPVQIQYSADKNRQNVAFTTMAIFIYVCI